MNPISPKISAAAGAASGSSPLAIIAIWLIGMKWQVPPEVAVAIGSLFAGAAGLLAGYLVPHGAVQPQQL